MLIKWRSEKERGMERERERERGARKEGHRFTHRDDEEQVYQVRDIDETADNDYANPRNQEQLLVL